MPPEHGGKRRLGRKCPPLFTYVIYAVGCNRVKIGRAYNPRKRLRDLQSTSPVKLRFIGFIRGDHESNLHFSFRRQRRHGEWFQIDAEMRVWLSEFPRCYGLRNPFAPVYHRLRIDYKDGRSCFAMFKGKPAEFKSKADAEDAADGRIVCLDRAKVKRFVAVPARPTRGTE